MFVVALAELRGSLDEEAAPLAEIAGLAAYDVRVRLAGALPRVVFQSLHQDDARRVLAAIRARGHGALACDSRDVIAGEDMVSVRRFSLDAASLVRRDKEGGSLAYDDLAAIILVAARTDVVRVAREKEIVPLGARPPKVVERDRTAHEHIVEQAAYLVARPSADRARRIPWVLREREAQFVSLGAAMRPTRHENFLATIALLRARAPGAIVDDRFILEPRLASQLIHVRDHEAAVASLADTSIDLSVHLLAEWLTRDPAGPYRGR